MNTRIATDFFAQTDAKLASQPCNIPILDITQTVSVNPAGIVNVSPRTISWWNAAFKSLAKEVGNIPISELTPQMLAVWHYGQCEVKSANTANGYLRGVKTACARLIKMRLLEINPAQYVPLAPAEQFTPHAAKLETYMAMRTTPSVQYRALVSFVWGTGCRIAEVCQVKLADMDWWVQDSRLCMAAIIRGKYHRRLSPDKAIRHVYADGLQAIDVKLFFDQLPTTRTYLFAAGDGLAPMSPHSAGKGWQRAVKHANLPPGTVANAHSFRHAFVYRKRSEGYPLEWISQWLGHSDPQFTAKMYGDKSEVESRKRFFLPAPNTKQLNSR